MAATMQSALKKYWSIAEVCERLSVGDSFVYGLIEKGMLKRIYLPSPRAKERKGVPRITGESLERYERGDVPVTPRPEPAGASAANRAKRLSSQPTKIRHFR